MNLSEIQGTVHAVSRSPGHGFSKQPQESIHLLQDKGVEGDAHAGSTVQHLYLKRRNPSAPNLMQVHLLSLETLLYFAQMGHAIAPGAFGENVTTVGLDLQALPLGTLLQLGNDTVVELTGLRTPCAKIDRFCPGLLQHTWVRKADGSRTARAGVMSVVRRNGDLHTGACIRCTLPERPHSPLRLL